MSNRHVEPLPVPRETLLELRGELSSRYGYRHIDDGPQRFLVTCVPQEEPDFVNDLEGLVEALYPADLDGVARVLLVGSKRVSGVHPDQLRGLLRERVAIDRRQCQELRTRLAVPEGAPDGRVGSGGGGPGRRAPDPGGPLQPEPRHRFQHTLYKPPEDPLRRPRLAVRIHAPSVQDLDAEDFGRLADRLGAHIETPRFQEVHCVYLIADGDHVRLRPQPFYEDLLGRWQDVERRREVEKERRARESRERRIRMAEKEMLLKELKMRYGEDKEKVASDGLLAAGGAALAGRAGADAAEDGIGGVAGRAGAVAARTGMTPRRAGGVAAPTGDSSGLAGGIAAPTGAESGRWGAFADRTSAEAQDADASGTVTRRAMRGEDVLTRAAEQDRASGRPTSHARTDDGGQYAADPQVPRRRMEPEPSGDLLLDEEMVVTTMDDPLGHIQSRMDAIRDRAEAEEDRRQAALTLSPTAEGSVADLQAHLESRGYETMLHPATADAIDLAAERDDAPRRIIARCVERLRRDDAEAFVAAARRLDVDLGLAVADALDPEARRLLVGSPVKFVRPRDLASVRL